MLRIFLILIVLAAGTSVAISHFRVGKKIEEITGLLDTALADKSRAEDNERKAREAQRESQALAESMQIELDDTKSALELMTANETAQRQRANQLDSELTVAVREKNEAQQRLNQYVTTGKTPPEILALDETIRKLVNLRDSLTQTNTFLTRENNRMTAELSRFLGKDTKVTLPEGLNGHVLAVDPKYDFVVLDIGRNHGAKEYGEMMVNRGGKLVAKIQLQTVYDTRSIANVLPSWKQSDLMEGDQVLY